MIETAVRSILLADPTVASLVGARIYTGILPQRPTFPAITLKKVDKLSGLTLSDAVGPNTLRLQVDCWANDVDGMRALAAAVNGADDQSTNGPLHGSSGGGASPSTGPTAGIYGRWPLDELGGNARKVAVGTGPDLLEVGGIVPEALGRFSYAARSVHTSTKSLRGTVTGVDFSAGITVSFLTKLAAAPASVVAPIASLYDGVGGFTPGGDYLLIYRFYNSDYLDFGASINGNAFLLAPANRLGPLDTTDWHLIVAWIDPADGIAHIEADGGAISKSVPTAVVLSDFAPDTLNVLGKYAAFEAGHCDVDELHIYPRVLTPTERDTLWRSMSVQYIKLLRLIVERSTEYESDTKLYRVSADYAVHL